MTPITYVSEQDRDYAQSLKAAQDENSLRDHVASWKKVASDACEQVLSSSFNWDEFSAGRAKENRNEYAGDGWAAKYGAILMPEVLMRVTIVALQFSAPWGCAYIRLKEAGVIDDSKGVAKWADDNKGNS